LSCWSGVRRSAAIAGAAAWLLCLTPVGVAAQPPPPVGTLHTIELPGGVEGIRRALGDRRTTAPATIGVELTRRFHGGTSEAAGEDPVLARLRVWLRTCQRAEGCGPPDVKPDRVPLPGSPALWRDVVFDGRIAEAQLMLAILDRRDAALLYTALLSMREDVRAWMLARPALVKALRGADAGALLVAAPYLRIHGDGWQLPGGPAAAPVWAALASGPPEPGAWLVALLRAHDGLPAYVIEVVATLPPAQQRAILALDATDARRVAAGTELLDALRLATRGWRIRDRPFWRPSCDPAFLLRQLRVGADGRLALPGGQAFWALVFGDGDLIRPELDVRAAFADPVPASPGWIVERIWAASPGEQPIRYEQVLFASRVLATTDASAAASVATVLRGYARYPQLLRVLDRMGVDEVRRLAALVRKADGLNRDADDWRGHAAIVRWQSVLAYLDHLLRFGGLTRDERDRALDVLADPGAASASRGTRVRALLTGLGPGAVAGDPPARPIEDALIDRLTRGALAAGRRVTWEGETYRIDFGAAERDRIARVRGRDAQPRLDAAWAAFALSDLHGEPDAVEALATLARVTAAARLDRTPSVDERLGLEARAAAATASRLLAPALPRRDWPAIRAALDDLGDALATEALGEMAYALNMGWAEDLPLTALAAFRRHVFVKPSPTGLLDASYVMPEIATGRREAWHVVGSLLGIGDALAPVALRRSSLKPLAAAPSLNTGDRRWLVATIAELDRATFTDAAQWQLVDLLSRGQARFRSIHGAAAARDAAEVAGTSALRQTLAGWIAEADPGSLTGVFSMTEILRLGSDGAPPPDTLAGWGNAQSPLTGRMLAGPLPSLPWERYGGRSRRLVSCALPDLQLSLAVRLAAMDLPAVLIVDLMPAATFELVNLAAPRHADDFDALSEYVRRLNQDSVERYLGLLTTAGPLRPMTARRTP
jgi:hypothetical protein